MSPPETQAPRTPAEEPGVQKPARLTGETALRSAAEARAPLPKAEFTCPKTDPMTPRQHWLNAVNALQAGDPVSAERDLQLALCQDPNNKIALSLLRQIREPPEALFGTQWSDYTVQPGDTLSKIAERFLGDPLLFYGLARYNQIDNPSHVKAGEVVRVPKSTVAPPPERAAAAPPLKQPAPVARKEVVPAAPPPADRTAPTLHASPEGGRYRGAVTVTLSATDDTDPSPVIHYTLNGRHPTLSSPVYHKPLRLAEGTTALRFIAVDASGNTSSVHSETYAVSAADRYAGVRKQIEAGDYESAIGELETALGRQGGDAEARALLVSACTKYADALSEQGDLDAAEKVLQKADASAPGDPNIRNRLRQLEKRVGAEQTYGNGVQAAKAGDLEKALSDFQKVLDVEPDNGMARQKVAETKKSLVELYSRRALAAFRHQELDEAIKQWDRVLVLDPDNELAKLRRAEAVDLKTRFEQKFENQPAK